MKEMFLLIISTLLNCLWFSCFIILYCFFTELAFLGAKVSAHKFILNFACFLDLRLLPLFLGPKVKSIYFMTIPLTFFVSFI